MFFCLQDSKCPVSVLLATGCLIVLGVLLAIVVIEKLKSEDDTPACCNYTVPNEHSRWANFLFSLFHFLSPLRSLLYWFRWLHASWPLVQLHWTSIHKNPSSNKTSKVFRNESLNHSSFKKSHYLSLLNRLQQLTLSELLVKSMLFYLVVCWENRNLCLKQNKIVILNLSRFWFHNNVNDSITIWSAFENLEVSLLYCVFIPVLL